MSACPAVRVLRWPDGAWEMVIGEGQFHLYEGDHRHSWFEDVDTVAGWIAADPRFTEAMVHDDLETAWSVADEITDRLPWFDVDDAGDGLFIDGTNQECRP